MFEKEAEEYATRDVFFDGVPEPVINHQRKNDWKNGAEFGYNKANEWHFVKEGDLPKKSISVLAYFKGEDIQLVECLYIPDEGFKHPIFSEWFKPVAWIETEKVLPKKIE